QLVLLRPRNQHAVVDDDLSSVELRLPANVLQRLARESAREQRFELLRVDVFIAMRDHPRERFAGDVGKQKIDVARIDTAAQRLFTIMLSSQWGGGAPAAARRRGRR